MIGKQINFYLTEADQRQLLEAIHAAVGCALIKRTDDSDYTIATNFITSNADWAVAYVCRPLDAEQTLGRILQKSSDSSRLLAIEFIRPIEAGRMLQRGRFWYSPQLFLGGEPEPKSVEFCDWAASVFRETKQHLIKFKRGDLIGGQARSLVESGELLID